MAKPFSSRTEMRILYDDEALYVGALLWDAEPDDIFVVKVNYWLNP